jgi:hypothetical protein
MDVNHNLPDDGYWWQVIKGESCWYAAHLLQSASRKHPVRQGFLNPQQTGFHKTTTHLPQSHGTRGLDEWNLICHGTGQILMSGPWTLPNDLPGNKAQQTSKKSESDQRWWWRLARWKSWSLSVQKTSKWFSRVSEKLLENHPETSQHHNESWSLAARGDHLRWCLAMMTHNLVNSMVSIGDIYIYYIMIYL